MCKTEKAMLNEIHLTWLFLLQKFMEVSQMENERNKPDCPLIGQDGNVFNLIGMASRTLKNNGMAAEPKEMSSRVFASGSYDEAL